MHHALSHLCILGMRNRQHSWLVSFSYILHYYGKIYFTKLFEFLNPCIAVLRIRTGKKLTRIQVISLRFTDFFKQKVIFKFFVLFAYFYPKT